MLIPASRRTMMVGELGKLLARGAVLFWGYTRVQWVQTDVSPHARVQGNFPADAAAPADGTPHPGTLPCRSTAPRQLPRCGAVFCSERLSGP